MSGHVPPGEVYEAVIAKEGVTTGAGAAAGNSIIDSSLIGVGANSFLNMLAVVYPGLPSQVDVMEITAFNNATGEVTLGRAYKGVAAAIPAGVTYKILTFLSNAAAVLAIVASLIGKPNVHDVVIYPVAEDAGITELADDGSAPAYYPPAAASTNAVGEGAAVAAWTEDINFEQEGTITIISIYAEFEWQTRFLIGAGNGVNSVSKIQISRDGGATWVDLSDNFINPLAAMTARNREGVGRWIPTIVAGANQLQFRLVHWVDAGNGISTSEAQIRSNSFLRITYRRS